MGGLQPPQPPRLVRLWSCTAEKEEIDIEHARNGGEKRVDDYFLDGYNEETHRAYEVHSEGYNVIEKWECDIRRELEEDEDMKRYFDHYHLTDPLEPRNLCTADEPTLPNSTIVERGRTNQIRGFHQFVSSCQPIQNRTHRSSRNHYRKRDQNVSNYFGLIKCTVLPPRALFHPVLPYHT